MRRAVDEVAGRDAVDVSDYENLVLLAADLEMRLGQVDSQMAALDDEARKQASVTDELSAGRVEDLEQLSDCLLYTSPSPRDATLSRMPSSA